jgi:hypothetical protein
MARPKLNDAEKKCERLTVRFRPGELAELSEQAEMSGLNVSELRRIGGLIKHLFNETNGLYRQKTGELLNELHAAAVRVGQRRGGTDDGHREDYPSQIRNGELPGLGELQSGSLQR